MVGQTPYALLRRFKDVPTERLKIMLGVGESNMAAWHKRSRAYREALAMMEHMREELKIREQSDDASR